MLVTSDAGRSWRHVCEASFADPGLQTDPVIALTPDGAVLAGISASIARSGAEACDFKRTLGLNNRQAVPDFTLSASAPRRALGILVSLLDGLPPLLGIHLPKLGSQRLRVTDSPNARRLRRRH
jgi:hypothetical protein